MFPPSQKSKAALLASLSAAERAQVLRGMTPEQLTALSGDWNFWGRPAQLLPGSPNSSNQTHGTDWLTWLILAGRGFGKTRTDAESVRQLVCGPVPSAPGPYSRIAIVAETSADARDVLVEGPAGLLACHPPDFRPLFEPSKRRLTWPNGAIATLFNGVEPDQLRGPQHDLIWWDELAKFRYAQEAWDQGQFGLRLGTPRQIVTTTPRPIPVIRTILSAPSTVVTRGSTYDNRANLAESFFDTVVTRYEGTRLGRQELNAEILDDAPGALWTRDTLELAARARGTKGAFRDLPAMARTVVALDPSGTKGAEDDGDSIGLIVAGRCPNGHAYVLADRTLKAGPAQWGRAAVEAYRDFHADRILGESNFGGAMVEHVIRTIDPLVPYKAVKASRGKSIRAEPVAALYEQGRVTHAGLFRALEDQMCLMTPDGYLGPGSPDRVDALVWALTELMLEPRSRKTGAFSVPFMAR